MRFVPPAGNGDRPADLAEFGLREVLESIAPSSGLLPDEIRQIRTFEEVGVLTANRGLVLMMADGTEFQVTIVRNK